MPPQNAAKVVAYNYILKRLSHKSTASTMLTTIHQRRYKPSDIVHNIKLRARPCALMALSLCVENTVTTHRSTHKCIQLFRFRCNILFFNATYSHRHGVRAEIYVLTSHIYSVFLSVTALHCTYGTTIKCQIKWPNKNQHHKLCIGHDTMNVMNKVHLYIYVQLQLIYTYNFARAHYINND